MGDSGELNYCFWRVSINVEGALCEVARSEVALHAAAPGADEGEIQHPADNGACERDETPNPFFSGFLAESYGKAFGNAGSEFFQHLFFGEVLAEIDAGSGSG